MIKKPPRPQHRLLCKLIRKRQPIPLWLLMAKRAPRPENICWRHRYRDGLPFFYEGIIPNEKDILTRGMLRSYLDDIRLPEPLSQGELLEMELMRKLRGMLGDTGQRIYDYITKTMRVELPPLNQLGYQKSASRSPVRPSDTPDESDTQP